MPQPTPAELDESDRICRNQQLREANARIVELEGLLREAGRFFREFCDDEGVAMPDAFKLREKIDAALRKAGA